MPYLSLQLNNYYRVNESDCTNLDIFRKPENKFVENAVNFSFRYHHPCFENIIIINLLQSLRESISILEITNINKNASAK